MSKSKISVYGAEDNSMRKKPHDAHAQEKDNYQQQLAYRKPPQQSPHHQQQQQQQQQHPQQQQHAQQRKYQQNRPLKAHEEETVISLAGDVESKPGWDACFILFLFCFFGFIFTSR
jgi:hypothetical protein